METCDTLKHKTCLLPVQQHDTVSLPESWMCLNSQIVTNTMRASLKRGKNIFYQHSVWCSPCVSSIPWKLAAFPSNNKSQISHRVNHLEGWSLDVVSTNVSKKHLAVYLLYHYVFVHKERWEFKFELGSHNNYWDRCAGVEFVSGLVVLSFQDLSEGMTQSY